MRIIILGAPGAGKGTQASKISKKLKIPHISTGDIFRYNIKNNTELGKRAKDYIEKGLLVPDDLTIDLVKDRLEKDDCKEGFLLDGFPRNINQAESLKKQLDLTGNSLDLVLNILVDDKEVIERISGRRVCSKCNESYHIKYNIPKKEGICDKCDSELIQRDDDKEETVLKRLNTYYKQTKPLEKFYSERNLLKSVLSREAIEDTTKEVFKVLGVD